MHWVREYAERDDLDLMLPKDINFNYVYRVFTSFTYKDPKEKREEVLAPSFTVEKVKWAKAKIKNHPCFRLFYRGAEMELNRYILWLREVYLAQETDVPAPLYVAYQKSEAAQIDIDELYPSFNYHFIGPRELEHYGLLAGTPDSKESQLIY